jgi:hypothetical protein
MITGANEFDPTDSCMMCLGCFCGEPFETFSTLKNLFCMDFQVMLKINGNHYMHLNFLSSYYLKTEADAILV